MSRVNAFWLTSFLALLIILFNFAAPNRFLSAFNLRTIAVNASVLIILSIGEAFVIATAGIDLSIGGILVFSTVVIAEVLQQSGGAASGVSATVGACVAGVVAGAVWGLINGIVVVRARVPALIVTLGSAGASLGLAQVITNGNDISNVPAALTNVLGNGNVVGSLPWLVVVAFVFAGAAAIVLSQTIFGRRTLAIGSSPAAAKRAGINVGRHVVAIYVLAGTCAGLGGVLSLSRFSATTIAGHSSDALAAIAAVVLGGTSLFGGSASIFGTVVGALIPTVLADGFVIIGFPSFWQSVAVGVILVMAVVIDRNRRSNEELVL